MAKSLEGKIAIVTGGSRGIGAEIARELAQRGASVAITYVSSHTKAEQVTNEIRQSFGVDTLAIRADSREAVDSSKKVVRETVDKFGAIDIIVNNAANGGDHTLADITEEAFNDVLHTNTLFPLLVVQESLPYLQKKARIVNVGSIGGRIPYPSAILYAASKAALESITKSLAFTLGREYEATVNIINPGPVETDMWDNTPGRMEIQQALYSRTAAGDRVASVQDIAPIVAFLCEEQSRWVTGSMTCANGGLQMV
ncbi:hypothetical protein FE257_010768 [Aspergillus nanangensis]|uniref:Ketoreductase domain-containing protein n=1 Tax=Aspergillus nanangensis TaxID=2582783 RepID=A0AAD4GY20_ASPNN|nr:hypothetical protein FE257_010768 [Aspergillus nanangensis]